jgi:pimeloyl-ACP methyl ester carboxylesterase
MNKQNKVIILLHGALGLAEDLAPVAQYLKDDGYETYTFNFSGHGREGIWPEEFRIDSFARELDAFIKARKLKNPIVFGHSMGGHVALYHKATFEDSPISHIITYGTKFNWSTKAVSKELPMLDPDHLLEKYPHVVETLQEKHGERWKLLLRSMAHLVQNLEKLDGLTREDLADVDIPVTLILGDLDRVVTSEETHLTASWLHHAQVKTLAHSKHELERSNLKELAQTIRDSVE